MLAVLRKSSVICFILEGAIMSVLCRAKILRIGDFLWFAGTNFCGSRRLKFLLGTTFCDSLFKQQNI